MKQVHQALSEARRYGLPATLTREQWLATVAHFHGLCAYCLAAPRAVFEHFVPVRHGGGTTAGNCLPACVSCNIRKGASVGDALRSVVGGDVIDRLVLFLRSVSTGMDVGKIPDVFLSKSPEHMNDPGGDWYSATNKQRRRPARKVTFSRGLSVVLPDLAGGDGRVSQYIEALVRADAAARGVTVPDDVAEEK